jgi:N-acyl-D-amino-acid deacylase
MRILIKDGLIIDGSGKEGYLGSVEISRDRIKKIIHKTDVNEALSECGFDKVIDAKGKVISPGFIDTHSHSDVELMKNPFIEPKIRQGITTEILGQDGISVAPLPTKYISDWRKNLAGLDGDSDLIDWNYKTTEGYLNSIKKSGLGLNESYLLPHGNVRMEAMGLENREPTQQELDKMKEIIKREMEAGAVGFSTGLIYIPCAYSKTNELIECCKVVASLGGVFVVHQRSEADDILNSMDEIIEIGRRSGVKVHFSHMKVCGKNNWDKIDQIFERLDQAKSEGIQVSFDQYPYVAGSTMLGVILPPWVHEGGTNKLIERLNDEKNREKIVKDIENGIPGWDNFVDFAGLDQIFITSIKTSKNQDLIGKNLIEVGKLRGKDPLNATFDLLIEEENSVGMVDFYGTEEHVKQFIKRPEQNVCTDGLLGGKPHPRVYGAFPRILGKYVREDGVLSLEEAICKMTSKPARVFGFDDRGLIKEGMKADIVVFDPQIIIDKGTYIEPRQFPEGINNVIINGEPVIDNGIYLKKLVGEIVKSSKAIHIKSPDA